MEDTAVETRVDIDVAGVVKPSEIGGTIENTAVEDRVDIDVAVVVVPGSANVEVVTAGLANCGIFAAVAINVFAAGSATIGVAAAVVAIVVVGNKSIVAGVTDAGTTDTCGGPDAVVQPTRAVAAAFDATNDTDAGAVIDATGDTTVDGTCDGTAVPVDGGSACVGAGSARTDAPMRYRRSTTMGGAEARRPDTRTCGGTDMETSGAETRARRTA